MIDWPLPVLRENIARVDDEEMIAPDDLAVFVDDADSVGIAIERDADVRAVLLHRGDQVLEILGNRRIGMMVREGAVALAEQTCAAGCRVRSNELRRDECSGAIAAIDDAP